MITDPLEPPAHAVLICQCCRSGSAWVRPLLEENAHDKKNRAGARALFHTGFTLVPRDGQTEVTWTMSGPMPFISKIMSVFMSMDRIVGKDFEKELAQLKAAAEK